MERNLSRSTIWIYGSLGFPLAMVGYPLATWLPRAYDTYIGIDTAIVGLIISAAAIFDAVTDPAMGYCSDRFRTRWGRRRTWVSIGAPFLLLALVQILNPAAIDTWMYLAFWFLFLRLGTTLLLVPYSAWGAELSAEYHTRTRIVSAREYLLLLGLMSSAITPAVVELIYGDATTAVMVLNAFTWPIVVVLPLAAVLVVWRVPEPPPSVREGSTPFLNSLGLMYQNKLFLRLVAIELLVTGGEHFRNALSLYFMQDYIGAPRVGMLYVIYFGMGIAAMPVWNYLARHYGKHRSLAAAIVMVSIVSVTIFTLDYGQIYPFYVLFALKGFCFGAFQYLPRAMMADVIDVDTMRSGDARGGSYFSIHGFMTKVAASIGGLSLVILGTVGYDTGVGATNSPQAMLWLGFLYAIVPTMLFAAGLWLCWTWPMTAEVHAKLQRVLEKRNQRLARREGRPVAASATDSVGTARPLGEGGPVTS